MMANGFERLLMIAWQRGAINIPRMQFRQRRPRRSLSGKYPAGAGLGERAVVGLNTTERSSGR